MTSEDAQRELELLREELGKASFDDHQSALRLSKVKVLARNPGNAPYVYRSDGLAVLSQIAFDLGDESEQRNESSLEAAKIIANALLLQPKLQQVFVDLGYTNNLVAFYGRPSADHEFIGGRILFLLTYESNANFGDLIEAQGLIDHVKAHFNIHIPLIVSGEFGNNPMNVMALTETLKLVYNVSDKCQAQSSFFIGLMPELMQIAGSIPLPSNPLDPPITQLLNAMGTIEWPVQFATTEDECARLDTLAKNLVMILEKCTSSQRPAQLESLLVAPLTVLRNVFLASREDARDVIRSALLPQDEERDKPLGQSKTLASRLLRLQSSAGVTVLPEVISGLLFDLSDRDAAKFIRNIGYGNAAGYLMTHQIAVPDDLDTTANEGRVNDLSMQVNPITGQRLDSEPRISMPEMTDEEKEQEAQRLFVMFERLKANGVVNVENPLRTAQQSGRFEELSDSEPD